MVLALHPEMPEHADIQDHIGCKGAEVHDLCQTIHTDVEEEWQKHERKSGNEERRHQRHTTLLVHLRERTWKRPALTHHVEHARDRNLGDQTGEDSLSERNCQSAERAEPLATHQFSDKVEAVRFVGAAEFTTWIDAGGDIARKRKEDSQDDDHDHHRPRRATALVLSFFSKRGYATESNEREHCERHGAQHRRHGELRWIEEGIEREARCFRVREYEGDAKYEEHSQHDAFAHQCDLVHDHGRLNAS